jgi:hypothetical protein
MDNQKKYYVYEHRRLDTGAVFYVGKGSGRRAKARDGRNDYWKKLVKNYGYSIHILYEGLSESDANVLEQNIISAYGRDILCNMTDGGDGMRNPSPETRIAMSNSAKGRKGYWTGKKKPLEGVRATAEKLKGRVGRRGDKHHFFGKVLSDERKKQNSDYMKNNFVFSDDHKRKISESKTGERHHMFDATMHRFHHENGEIFIGNQFSFRKNFKLSQSAVRRMVIGERKSKLFGWSYMGCPDVSPE